MAFTKRGLSAKDMGAVAGGSRRLGLYDAGNPRRTNLRDGVYVFDDKTHAPIAFAKKRALANAIDNYYNKTGADLESLKNYIRLYGLDSRNVVFFEPTNSTSRLNQCLDIIEE